MAKNYLIIVFLLLSVNLAAQDMERKNLYYGNRAFENKEYDDAIEYYQEALNNSPLSFKPAYNMANAYFRKNDFQKAADMYGSIIDLAPTAFDRALVYHNLGNSYFMNQKLDDAIDAYKSALKLNPKDEDTRYNLAYALEMKKQQQQQQEQEQEQEQEQDQNENQDQNDNQNENENDNQNESGNQNENENGNQNENGNEENQDSQNNGGDKSNQDKNNQQQGKMPKISKEQAKRMLEAALKSEKDTRGKMEKHKVVGTGESKKKDW